MIRDRCVDLFAAIEILAVHLVAIASKALL